MQLKVRGVVANVFFGSFFPANFYGSAWNSYDQEKNNDKLFIKNADVKSRTVMKTVIKRLRAETAKKHYMHKDALRKSSKYIGFLHARRSDSIPS